MRASNDTIVPSGSAVWRIQMRARVAVHVPEERLLPAVDHLHRPSGPQGEEAGVDLEAHVLAGAERSAHAAEA